MYSTEHLSHKLNLAKDKHKLTVKGFSDKTNLDINVIRALFYRSNPNPTLKTLIKLSKAFKQPIEWFVSK